MSNSCFVYFSGSDLGGFLSQKAIHKEERVFYDYHNYLKNLITDASCHSSGGVVVFGSGD